MNSPLFDTPPNIEHLLIEGYRKMSPAQKLQRVTSLNRTSQQLASSRLRARCGDLPDRKLRLRLALLRLDREVKVFGWDPLEHGY